MGKRKELIDAEARVAALQATIDAAAAADKEAEAKVAPAVKRHAALAARQSKMLALTSAGGSQYSEGGAIKPTSIVQIGLTWGGDRGAQLSAKALAASLLSGETKINGLGSVTYTLRGYLGRTRLIDKARLRAVDRASKARLRAQHALHAAWQVEAEAYHDAYEKGDKPDPAAIAALIAQRIVAHRQEQPTRDHEAAQRAREASWHMADALAHLEWVKATNPDKGVCPCQACQRDRQAVIRQREIAALPTAMFDCSACGRRHRGATMVRGNAYIEPAMRAGLADKGIVIPEDVTRHDLPVIHCDKHDKWFANVKALAPIIASETRAAARRRKVTFTCPNPDCGQDPATSVLIRGDDELDYVECSVCETVFLAKSVKTTKAAA